jgi:cytoskeleton protein RodZ
MSEPGAQEPMSGDEQAVPATPANPAPVSPGARLAAGREEHGWTIEQVAAHLKLASRQIAALERDDYSALPGMPIVRGFIRSYAKLLKIDAAPLLAQLGGETVLASESLKPKEGLATPFSEARLPSMSERPAISSKWVIGLLLIVLLAAGIWAMQQENDLFGLVPQSSMRVEQAAPDGRQQEGSVQEETVRDPLPPMPEPGEAPEVPAAGTAAPPVPQPAPAPEQAAPPPQPEVPAAASGTNTLNLIVREESWIEIRRSGSGNTVLARLAQPGENISVEVNEPVALVIGNAAGVDVSLRGVPLQLKGSTTSNVARLNLK